MTEAAKQTRKKRGEALVRERGSEIVRESINLFLVPGSGEKIYQVDAGEETCDCPDTPPRGEVCKHVEAVRLVIDKPIRKREHVPNPNRPADLPDGEFDV